MVQYEWQININIKYLFIIFSVPGSGSIVPGVKMKKRLKTDVE